MLLSSTHLLELSGPCFDHAYPFNRSIVSLFSSSFIFIKCFISFKPGCCPRSFLPLLPFIQQFRRQCIAVSSSIFSSYQVLTHFLFFSIGVLPEFLLPCYSSLPECSQLCCSLLHSFFQLFNLSRFFGFTLLSKKQLSFTSSLSLPFSLRCHSRSRDEILSQWWSVVTPRDRCARCLPVIHSLAMPFACVLHLALSSCALHHIVLKTCIRPGLLVPSVVRSEPIHTCTRPRHV